MFTARAAAVCAAPAGGTQRACSSNDRGDSSWSSRGGRQRDMGTGHGYNIMLRFSL